MNTKESISIAWLRRDLRLDDNRAIYEAHQTGDKVLVLFIFDTDIIDELGKDDHRITFIYDNLEKINTELNNQKSALLIQKGRPLDIWKKLVSEYDIKSVHIARDYEPYAKERDREILDLLSSNNIIFKGYKDQVVFEKSEIVKQDNAPYTVFTPYKNKWVEAFKKNSNQNFELKNFNFLSYSSSFPSLTELGFKRSEKTVQPFQIDDLNNYKIERDIPSLDHTSKLSPHLRFGTVSIRKIVDKMKGNEVFLSELIWREFFMQILYHFPQVIDQNFKEKYNGIQWRNDEVEFKKWCAGTTGYPMVDAGMRQLNQTGYMHNRVRMITAGFLCKHLLIDWRWGEAYFAKKLFDYELSANNGNWQWAAGTGCDAAPYFRIFNPEEQLKKFDPKYLYINKWIPEFGTDRYPSPMVDHKEARLRALDVYKRGIAEK
jgi:deoxyribodipyrimidine photo-lyase